MWRRWSGPSAASSRPSGGTAVTSGATRRACGGQDGAVRPSPAARRRARRGVASSSRPIRRSSSRGRTRGSLAPDGRVLPARGCGRRRSAASERPLRGGPPPLPGWRRPCGSARRGRARLGLLRAAADPLRDDVVAAAALEVRRLFCELRPESQTHPTRLSIQPARSSLIVLMSAGCHPGLRGLPARDFEGEVLATRQ